MSEQELTPRVDHLEEMMMQLCYEHSKTERSISNLSKEMKEFKDEMRDFKDEMRAFKDDTQAFKDEMRVFQNEMKEFKDEMRDYKDDTQAFKDEMKAYRADTQAFKDEMRASKKENDRRWGDLVNKLGTLVEDIVAPGLPRIVKEDFGFSQIDDFMINRRVKDKKEGVSIEIDALVISGETVFVNETKSKPKIEYVNDFMQKLNKLPSFLPEYADKNIIPLFSSLFIPEDILNYLTKNRIYALGMGEDVMEVLNMDQID